MVSVSKVNEVNSEQNKYYKVMVRNNDNVQPGWIFDSKFKKFLPPKIEHNLNIMSSPCRFQTEVILKKKMKDCKHNYYKARKDDIKSLKKSETCLFVICTVSMDKYIDEPEKKADYQYARRVLYTYNYPMMIVHNKECKIQVDSIKNILLNNWQEKEDDDGVFDKTYSQMKAVWLFSKKINDSRKALVIAINNLKMGTHKMVSVNATVNKLSCTNSNRQSVLFKWKLHSLICLTDLIRTVLGKKEKKKPNAPLLDENFCNPNTGIQKDIVRYVNEVKGVPEQTSKHIVGVKDEEPSSCSGENLKKIDSGNSVVKAVDGIKPAGRDIQLEKTTTVNGEEFLMKSLLIEEDVRTDCENIIHDEAEEFLYSAEILKKKLHEPSHCVKEDNYEHKYYFKPSEIIKDVNSKILLFFGSVECGQLSLLNIIWYNSLNDREKMEAHPVVNISTKINHITFHHFKAPNHEIEELIIITTPPLTNSLCGNLQTLLSEGTFNTHALGFVPNSRHSTLTSEERSFFNFITSSFGEVSSHHMMTFMTFCGHSKSFPVLDDLKDLGIKAKGNFQFANVEVGLQKRLDAIETSFMNQDFKEMDAILGTLKDLPQLSLKVTKMKHKISFVKSHVSFSLERLKEELKQLIAFRNSLDDVSKSKLDPNNDVIDSIVQSNDVFKEKT